MAKDYICKDCGYGIDNIDLITPIKLCDSCGRITDSIYMGLLKCPRCGCEWFKVYVNQIK